MLEVLSPVPEPSSTGAASTSASAGRSGTCQTTTTVNMTSTTSVAGTAVLQPPVGLPRSSVASPMQMWVTSSSLTAPAAVLQRPVMSPSIMRPASVLHEPVSMLCEPFASTSSSLTTPAAVLRQSMSPSTSAAVTLPPLSCQPPPLTVQKQAQGLPRIPPLWVSILQAHVLVPGLGR